jgi:hypothetical protein
MQLPKFSVVTVSFNHGEFIRDTIESVLAQDYPNFEHIVIDGGSTDNTTAILREYPHLKWVSEPDRGQSHALNKGISRAAGDVIAWINSDDWYAPGAFHAVAREIVDYPIVMGRCSVVDKIGNLKEDVANVERTWMDTLKYWVFHSSPAQQSIFFTRAVLGELGITYDSVVDEGLNFTMDFDLWLRIQECYPLTKRIEKTLAYFRTYDTNKTGQDMASTYREFSRVYRRHTARRIGQEQGFTFVLPVAQSCAAVEPFVASVAAQEWGPVECVVVDYAETRELSRKVMREVLQLGANFKNVAFQHARVGDDLPRTRLSALEVGVRTARSPLVACLDTDRIIPKSFIQDVQAAFLLDNRGILFPSLDDAAKQRLFTRQNGALMFNPIGPLSSRLGEPEFVVRTIAAMDVGGFQLSNLIGDADEYPLKRLLLMLAHKAWLVTAQDLLSPRAAKEAPLLPEVFRVYCNSLLIDELVKELDESPFARLRATNGFALAIPEPLRDAARGVLSNAPAAFRIVTAEKSEEELGRVAMEYPAFGPASYLLSLMLERQGRSHDARAWRDRWISTHEQEQQSALYGAQS